MILGAILLLVVSQDSTASIDRWRESIELDLARAAAEEAWPLVTGRGPLARDGRAIATAARALAASGDPSRAEKLLAEAQAEKDSSAYLDVARGRLLLERDELVRARTLLLDASLSARHPAIPECWLLAGRALARSGDLARAAPLFERFLALAPLDSEAPSAWHALAQAAIASGNGTRAAELREKALASARWQAFYRTRRLQAREQPDEPLPRLGIAELFLAAGENEKAEGTALELTKRWPGFCRGHEVLGRAERALRRLDLARAALERAVACDPASARAHLELARTLDETGEKDAAKARYARYRELGGDEPLVPR